MLMTQEICLINIDQLPSQQVAGYVYVMANTLARICLMQGTVVRVNEYLINGYYKIKE